MIVKEYHPFSIVEDKEFRKLLNMLSPNYIIPSRKTVSNSLLPQMYEMVVQRVKDKLKKISLLLCDNSFIIVKIRYGLLS